MKRAIVIYHSKTGTTKKYGEAIGEYLNDKGSMPKLLQPLFFEKKC